MFQQKRGIAHGTATEGCCLVTLFSLSNSAFKRIKRYPPFWKECSVLEEGLTVRIVCQAVLNQSHATTFSQVSWRAQRASAWARSCGEAAPCPQPQHHPWRSWWPWTRLKVQFSGQPEPPQHTYSAHTFVSLSCMQNMFFAFCLFVCFPNTMNLGVLLFCVPLLKISSKTSVTLTLSLGSKWPIFM